ncbi:MAG TPA: LysE/ArgO family amino acid transporter [Propionibacteriaceae bacterium]|nr:LysE/ArgO family amino acid transporter [Propionibacteriaceae bacterium]
MLASYLTGLVTGLSLIVAIGAQNAYVLRQGLRREHVGEVVVICALSDLLLIAVGTLGIGTLVRYVPWLLIALTWGGVAYLLWFAYRSFRSARHPAALSSDEGAGRASVVATALALTYLNPHVYLDTVVMLGTLATQQDAGRWVFAAGAGTGSVAWFTALGFGARALSKPLGRPRTWQVVDVLVGLTMLAVAVRLAVEAL